MVNDPNVLVSQLSFPIGFGEVFHLGTRVPDVPAAMEELSGAMGLNWARVHHIEMPAWVPGKGYQDLYLNIVFSVEGPVHIELLEGSPGSVWDPAFGTGVHHVGVFVDDVGDVSSKLVGLGWTVEMACSSPEEGYGGWTYMRSPTGLLVEPVASESRDRFARYWAGGSLV